MKKAAAAKKKKNTKADKIVITAALPYANGQIHIGHLLEYIQADIYTRFLKLLGKQAIYICASDMHGTPVEVNARKAGKEPEEFANSYWKEHQHDFASFLIHFDNYYKTHSAENKELAEHFYTQLKKKGYINIKKMNVIYCPHCVRYLPDRYVKGTCPHCTTVDQYGDVCENCSSALKGTDLLNPKCSLCGRTPQAKESQHYFFTLTKFKSQLQQWMKDPASGLQPEVCNWLSGWMDKGLDDWCISRDAPYFGFEIPQSKEETGETKYFYVWLDAPIGYISSTKNYCDKHQDQWEEYWKFGAVQHFLGKDISYFHFLFWPAMLLGVGLPLPKLTVHGFITVNGQKMSKSRGTFFTAKDFLKLYPAESLRFFYASHLDRKIVDVDLNFDDFKATTNNVLMGSLGNFCYRVLTFAQKNYDDIQKIASEKALEKEIIAHVQEIRRASLEQDFKAAVKYIIKIADIGNVYFQQAQPWKDPTDPVSISRVGWCVNVARILAIVSSPILPAFCEKIHKALKSKNTSGKSPGKLTSTSTDKPSQQSDGTDDTAWHWDDINFGWQGKVGVVEKLVDKIEQVPSSQQFPLHLVAGKIMAVQDHPNADALYVLQVDFGKEIGTRQVVAGLKKHFDKQLLQERKAVFCINMKPAAIRGQKSEAMVLVADDSEAVSLLDVSKTTLGEEVTFQGMANATQEVTFDEFKKLVMTIKEGKVFFDSKKMATPVEDVVVHGIKDGARLF